MAITLDKATMQEIRDAVAARLETVEAQVDLLRQQAATRTEQARRRADQALRLRTWLAALDADLLEE